MSQLITVKTDCDLSPHLPNLDHLLARPEDAPFFAINSHKCPKRYPVYGINCFANFFSKNSWWIPNPKLIHPHAKLFCNNKMPKFMNYHESN